MAARGEIESYDFIIFADTGIEPFYVRRYIGWLQAELRKHDMELHVARGRDGFQNVYVELMQAVTEGSWFASIPYFIKMPNGYVNWLHDM